MGYDFRLGANLRFNQQGQILTRCNTDMPKKTLLYLSDNQLTVFRWEKRHLVNKINFSHDETGWEAFSNYLSQHPHARFFLIVDSFSEDFRLELLPHLYARDRKLMLERKLGQLYRTTPYYCAELQGRDSGSRKDDRYQFSALTDAELLEPWLDCLENKHLILHGISSPAHLTALLTKKLHWQADYQLVITKTPGQLRQTFLEKGQLRFSRLVMLSEQANALEALVGETQKMQTFLQNQRLLPRDVQLTIQLVCSETQSTELDHYDFPESETARFVLHKTAEYAGLCQLPPDGELDSRTLLLSMLRTVQTNQNIYAPAKRLNNARYWQIGHYCIAGAILLFVSSLSLALYNWQARLDNMLSQELTQQSLQNAERQRKNLSITLPASPLSPALLKNTVDTITQLQQNLPTPQPLLQAVSQVLAPIPQLELQRLHWVIHETKDDPLLPLSNGSQMPNNTKTPPPPGNKAASVHNNQPHYQTLRLEGRFTMAADALRTQQQAFESLNLALAHGIPRLNIHVIRPPLNLAVDQNLTGATQSTNDSNPTFILDLTQAPPTP